MDNKCEGEQGGGSRPLARILHGEVHIRTVGANAGAISREKKLDCLRPHFMRFEGSLIGNKAAKSEI